MARPLAVDARRAALYLRISSDLTGEAAGVGRQEALCRDLAAQLGWSVIHVFSDNDTSAYSGVARPGYEALLKVIESGAVDAVVAYHPDRLYRRLRDLGRLTDALNRRNIQVRTVAAGSVDLTTASGRFNAQVLAASSEHESARIGERVSVKHQANARAGRAHGGAPPYGYARGNGTGTLVVDEAQAAIVREMVDRVLEGATISGLTIELNERGVPAARGGRWNTSSLGKMLRSPTMAGLRSSQGEVIGEATWPPIIDRSTHERVVARLTHAPVGPRVRRNILAGYAWCGECGARMKGRTEGRSGDRGRQYACDRVAGGCGSCSASAERVEEHVIGLVIGTAATIDLSRVRARRGDDDAAELTALLADDEQLLADLAKDLAERRLTRAEWAVMREPITGRIAATRGRLAALNSPTPDTALADGLTLERWDALTFEQRRQVIDLFVDRVTVRKGRRGRNFDYGRINLEWKV